MPHSSRPERALPAGKIKAIPTVHDGISFRSRLEARVAATMTMLGCRWEYEQEGYVLHDGTHYLPDFKVGAAYIEVKPGGYASDDTKIAKMAESDPDLRCYLVSENRTSGDGVFPRVSSLTLIRVRGAGLRSSAVWVPCPSCSTVAPWTLYDPSPCGVCGVTSDPDQWWDRHYANDHKRRMSMVWPTLPQYQDGSFIWDDYFNKARL